MLSPIKVAPHLQVIENRVDNNNNNNINTDTVTVPQDPERKVISPAEKVAGSAVGDDCASSDDDEDDIVAPVDEVARTAAYVRLASSHLIQMRGPRANLVGFRDMVSSEPPPPEVVTPNRLAAQATQPKAMNTKIRSFDVIKSLYVFLLIPIHLTNLTHWVEGDGNAAYASSALPYKTTDHGQEYIMGMMLLSGWLSNATLKPSCSLNDFFQKKLIRLMPSYFIGAIPLSLICIIIRVSVDAHTPRRIIELFAQLVLEIFTLGPWNPAMIWWTSNLPLWFMNTLLAYYYVSWHFIRWIRSFESAKPLVVLLIVFLVLRIVTAAAVLICLTFIYPETYESYGFLIHTWTLVQLYLPFMGAILAEIAARVGPMKMTKTQIWIITDVWTLCLVSLAFFIGPFSNNSKIKFIFANLCDYGDLLVAPFLLIGLYFHSHDFSTLSYMYSKFPRFWADLVRLSFPAFLFHWPIMICLIIFSRNSLQFDKPMDVVFISGMCVLIAAFVDSYIVLAFEDGFIEVVKPKIVTIMLRFEGGAKDTPVTPKVVTRKTVHNL